MNQYGYDDPAIWKEMRERLMGLTMKQLKALAKEEEITLSYAAYQKETCVGAIVAERRRRARQYNIDPSTHPWRRWRSVTKLPARPADA